MAACCARLSKIYILITNLLFACLGIAFIATGVIGKKDGFKGATLFPPNTFQYLSILGGIIIIASLVGILGAFFRHRLIVYLYLLIVIIALIFQVYIGVKVYQKASNAAQYLAPIWTAATSSFRANLQNEFSCCGFQTSTDNIAITDTCNPSEQLISLPPCASILQGYVKSAFGKVYLVIFAALAVELLAFSNGFTMLCTPASGDLQDEEERRRRRKSGIRLDDMSVETPVSSNYPTNEQKDYYAGGGGGVYETNDHRHRHDSYDIYQHNNNHAYNETYSRNNGGAYY